MKMGLRAAIALGTLGAALPAPAQVGDQSFAFFEGGRSYIILGARDERAGGVLGYQLVRDDPKFRKKGFVVRPVETIYLMNHFGHDSKYGDTDTFAIGAMYGLRMQILPESRLYLEYDFGPQFDSVRSHGLPSEFNVTPHLTIGTMVPGKTPLEFGITYLHISNMYTERPNFGQDFLLAFIGVKI